MAFGKTAVKALITISLLIALCSTAFAQDADYEKGLAYLRAGKAEEALKVLEPLSAGDPGNPLIAYHLGLAYYKAGRLDKAYDAFEKTLTLTKGASGKDFGLGVAFSNVGVGHFRKKEFDQAVRCFERALSLDPNDGDSRYYLGLVKAESQDYEAALGELGQAALLKTGDKEKALVQNAVGMVYYKQEKADRAILEFTKTLSIDPDNLEALYYLGLLNYKENGYAAARQYFDRIAARGAPDDKTRQSLFTTFFNMGVDFQNRDKAEAASEMFEKASGLRPDDPDAHFYRGYNLMVLERYEDAIPEFRQSLALKPDMARAKAQLEVAGKFAAEQVAKAAGESLGRGDCYAALTLFERAARLDPASAEAKKGLKRASEAALKDAQGRMAGIKARLGKGEYLEAVEAAAELLRLNPGLAEAETLERQAREKLAAAVKDYLARARDAEERDALGEAAGYYGRLLKADPGNQSAAVSLRQVNGRIDAERACAVKAAEDGQLAAARKSYERLLKYLPGDPDVQNRLKDMDEKISAELGRLLDRARNAYDGKEYLKAAASVGKALELSPQNKDAQALNKRVSARVAEQVARLLGEADGFLKEGLRDRAAGSFKAALELDPDNAAARKGIERAQMAPTPTPGAVDGEEVRRLYLQGVEYYTNGQLQEALSAWRQVLKLDPGNDKAISSISKAEEKLKQTEKP